MAVDKAIDSTEFDSKLTTVADAIRTAGGTTETMSFPSGMVEAITAIQAGGGSSWTDSYSVFATGSFTPTENVTEWSIDTGVPFDCSNKRNYLRQSLIVWREPDETTISGLVVCAKRGYTRTMTNGSSSYFVGGAVGSSGGSSVARAFKANSNSLPQEGETIWTISDLNTGTNFRSGKPYRWILLGVLK